MENKKYERPHRQLFRSWLRTSPNSSKSCQLTGNVLSPAVETSSVVNSCFTNDVIIANILKYVTDFNDLLSCRQINSSWTPIVTTRLIKSNVQCKSFNYYYIKKCYRSENGQLSKLNECGKNSVKFPFTSFTFQAGDMRSDDAQTFLTTMGTSVETLTLDAVYNGDLCGKMNLTAILSRTPNLRTLIFKGGSYYHSTFTSHLILPALKTIQMCCKFTPTGSDIEFILDAAPNLETFDAAWHLDDPTPIMRANKIHTVKKWCPDKSPCYSGLVRITSATVELRLQELVVNICLANIDESLKRKRITTQRLWECYLQLLETNTIQRLILSGSNYPNGASFPLNMNSVNELVLMPSGSFKLNNFPAGINLTATFPNVTTLSLCDEAYHSCFCTQADWDQYFPLSDDVGTVGILPSVTTLNLRGRSVSIEMLIAMKTICPNVQNLELCVDEGLCKITIIEELCDKWRNLINLSMDMRIKKYDHFSLDSPFTGLREETLKSISKDQSLTDTEKLRKAADMRQVPWIGNISGLVKLNIICDLLLNSTTMSFIPFTEYSVFYAFNLMPNLKVYINDLDINSLRLTKIKTMVASVSPLASSSSGF